MTRRFLLALVTLAWAMGAGAVGAQAQGRRVALVIGNGSYRSVDRLANPENDAKLVAATLRAAGFELVGAGPQLDLDKPRFDRAVQAFGQAVQGADVALFYYSGHGMQVGGVNWLVPVDANPGGQRDLDFQMVDASLVVRQMEHAGTKLNLVILDACRNNPFATRGIRASGGGLAEMQAPEGTLISYATQPGNVAADGAGGNSPYTAALVNAMRTPGLDIFRVFNQVGLTVKQSTAGQQLPWVASSPIAGNFYFFTGPTTLVLPPAPVIPVMAPPPPSAPTANRFDGTWKVILDCAATADGAVGWSRTFTATIAGGRLHGGYGARGANDSLELDGQIGGDGRGMLTAAGLTGSPQGTMGHRPEGSPFTYHVDTTFQGERGEGHRVEQRACKLTLWR